MPRALIFSDIHNDGKALEKLMDIEADYYFAAGDLVYGGPETGAAKRGNPADFGAAGNAAAKRTRRGAAVRWHRNAVAANGD